MGCFNPKKNTIIERVKADPQSNNENTPLSIPQNQQEQANINTNNVVNNNQNNNQNNVIPKENKSPPQNNKKEASNQKQTNATNSNHPQIPKPETKQNKPVTTKDIIMKLIASEKDFNNELNNSFFDDEDKFKDELNEFYQKFERKFKSYNLTKSEIEKYVRESRIINHINTQCMYKKWDCHKILTDYIPINFGHISEENLGKVNKLLTELENYYPKNQMGIMYNFCDNNLNKFYSFKPKDLNKKLSNVSEYKLEVLNIRFRIEDFKEKEWITSLAELIEKQKGLITVCINIDSDDSQNITNLLNQFNLFIPVLNSIKNNKSIKNFFLRSLISNEVELGGVVCKELMDISECENIISFVVLRFIFPLSFINSICVTIPKNKSLKTFGMDNIRCEIQYLDKLIQAFGENTSLKAILLGGNKLSEENLGKFHSLVMQNEALSIFHYES